MTGKAWDPKVWDAIKEQRGDPPDGLPLHPVDPPRSQALEEPPFTAEESKRFIEQMQQLADEKRARDEAIADEREAARAWLPVRVRAILSEIDANVAALGRVDLAPIVDASRRIAEIMAGLGTQEPAPVVNQTLTAKGDLVERLCVAYGRETSLSIAPTGIRAVIDELASMAHADALPTVQAYADELLGECGQHVPMPVWDKLDPVQKACFLDMANAARNLALATLAAKDATIAEQARELSGLQNAYEDEREERRMLTAYVGDLEKERDSAREEVARLKAEAEATCAKAIREALECAAKEAAR